MTILNLPFSILILLLLAGVGPVPAAGSDGPALAVKKNCVQCHRFSPEDPEDRKKAPDLFYAGDKFQERWLREFLVQPTVLRQAGYITDPGFLKAKPATAGPHMSLSPEEAEVMSDYLLSLNISSLQTGKVDGAPLTKGKKARAKFVFERNYGCHSCHQTLNLAGKVRGGISGPSLVDAGNRLRPDWMFNWLKNPRRFEPKGRMPILNLDDETAVLLTQFLQTLKKENIR